MNVHINHPPEATVQIHQVARVRGDTEVSEENSVEAVLVPQLAAMPWYTYTHGNGNSIAPESSRQQQRAPGLLGRCFREALHGQVRGHPSSFGACVDTFLVGYGCIGLWGREGGLSLHEAVEHQREHHPGAVGMGSNVLVLGKKIPCFGPTGRPCCLALTRLCPGAAQPRLDGFHTQSHLKRVPYL